ncbi:hypothetical protein [Chryseobacterium sp. JM1]|uniref:hypothetical protein n=1 Tax=Chryseobacterium sp. JM1 TaxID=1233950 RepID=UPI0004E60385|nr:hypothetical protein [Chryseobacterium sp. JM1]KFF21449.1 hypothetical protein IW22_05635 [Chryseobacterium sp. JM1]
MTSVHIYSDTSDRAVFNYEFEDYFTSQEGEEFNFDENYYSRLPERYKRNFDKHNLKIGKYLVHDAYEDDSVSLGKISYIFIKPVKE